MNDKDSKTPSDKPKVGETQQSGRVAYDAKGNPTWEWQTSTGVFGRDVSTQRLEKLEANLSLEETQPVSTPGLATLEPDRLPGGGINPYDVGGRTTSTAPTAAHPALVHKRIRSDAPKSNSLVSKYAAKTKPSAPTQAQGFWQKLKALFNSEK